jgi:hypothetical protein
VKVNTRHEPFGADSDAMSRVVSSNQPTPTKYTAAVRSFTNQSAAAVCPALGCEPLDKRGTGLLCEKPELRSPYPRVMASNLRTVRDLCCSASWGTRRGILHGQLSTTDGYETRFVRTKDFPKDWPLSERHEHERRSNPIQNIITI